MPKYIKLFGCVGGMGVIVALSGDGRLLTGFCLIIALTSILISIGGLKAYLSQEEIDKREVHREYREQHRAEKIELIARINSLTEENINLQKEIYAARQREAQDNSKEKRDVACLVGCGVLSE